MCPSAVLLTNTMLDRLRVMPRSFINDSTTWIPSTSPWLPRDWTSLVTASCDGIRSADSIDLSFWSASGGRQKVSMYVYEMSLYVLTHICFSPLVWPFLLCVMMSKLVAISLSWKPGTWDSALRETQVCFWFGIAFKLQGLNSWNDTISVGAPQDKPRIHNRGIMWPIWHLLFCCEQHWSRDGNQLVYWSIIFFQIRAATMSRPNKN